jgi:hypothetical protein
MINNLDLQCRFHYAPSDSASHIAEKVMRSLNECLGDGRSIPVPKTSLVDMQGKLKMNDISNDEVQRLQHEEEESIAKECAEEVRKRFNGIHALKPCYEEHRKFFFDEKYMLMCVNAAPSNLERCAGKGYFEFVKNFFQEHYFVYDNGFEGHREGCGINKCEYHATIGRKTDDPHCSSSSATST